jgi:DNA (cytosine-5)-methyltransferase 1
VKVLSLFAGVGGFDLACERSGVEIVGQVEIDGFCQRVLERRFSLPATCRSTDIRQWRESREHCDLLTGGFPCQDLSIAGKRAGLSGERSGLFWEIIRIAKAKQPTWGLFENVPGLLSSHGGRDFALVLAGLRECWPAVGYRILDSQYFGVPQRRRRVFLVGGPSEASVRAVLFESEGSSGHSAESSQAGTEIARTIATGTNGNRYDGETENFIVGPLTAEAAESHRHGHQGFLNNQAVASGHIVATLNSGGNNGGFRTEPGEHRYQSVRRLTPLECERIQGFPDGFTCCCQPLEFYRDHPDEAATRCTCPDSPRYRALGNAVTVSTVEWIVRRIVRVDAMQKKENE